MVKAYLKLGLAAKLALIELFETFGFDIPNYIHTPNIMKKDDNGNLRKISKRKDPEASMSYYTLHGYPTLAVKESLMTIINSNYEEWHTANPDKSYLEFVYSPKKMSATGGALYDMEKLNNISKNIISKMSAVEVYDELDKWTSKYDKEFNELINKYKDYTIGILNIEREQKKPRKDFENYESVRGLIWYMYDELYKPTTFEYGNINDLDEIKNILNTYMEKYYNESDDKDEWFNKIKLLCDELGYASNMKEYRENPDNFKGNVADVSTVIRVSITSKSQTPDLYEIMRLLGKTRIIDRISKIKID